MKRFSGVLTLALVLLLGGSLVAEETVSPEKACNDPSCQMQCAESTACAECCADGTDGDQACGKDSCKASKDNSSECNGCNANAESKEQTGCVACKKCKKDPWLTHYSQAVKQAKATKRPILMLFTGSDWCPWCIKLEEEIFSQKEFKKYAGENLVLLKLDFPRKSKQTPQEKRLNNRLQQRFEVEGFPTVVVIDEEGDELFRTGYRRGGAEAYVKHLEDSLRNAFSEE